VLEVNLCHEVLGFDHVALLICTLPFSSAAGSQEDTMGCVMLSFPCSLPWSNMSGSRAQGTHSRLDPAVIS